jgi:DNA invertase Pin-like site-specific DNA recombinase
MRRVSLVYFRAVVLPWLGYTRVSFVGGRYGDRFRSPTEQAESMRIWARRRGEPVVLLEPELDESGARSDRPILMAAVERIERGEARGLVVAYLSRAGRSTRHLLELWDRIEAAGAELHAVAENIDTTTPAGRLTRTMLAAIAEHELDVHRERFESQRASATARGIWQRRQTPLGYRRDPITRRLVPDANAARVQQAFQSRVAGRSISRIALDLGLTPAGTRALLRNRVYLGELSVGVHRNPSAHPAVVREEEWLAVQRTRGTRPARSNQPPALLAGLVRCASCGHVMPRATGGPGHRTYACHRQHSAGCCPRPAAVTLKALDRHVTEIALGELAKLRATAARSDRKLAAARDALLATEAELAAYLEGVAAAGLLPGEYAEGARTRKEQVEHAREQLGALLGRQPGFVSGEPVSVWGRMHVDQRNRLLRSLIDCVLVAPVGRGRRVSIADRSRVIAHGARLVEPYRGGGVPMPIRQLPMPDVDDPVVLGV